MGVDEVVGNGKSGGRPGMFLRDKIASGRVL